MPTAPLTQLLFTAAILTLSTAANAIEPMSPPKQTALVLQYCAVCHTDTVKNGGLSLQNYDAAQSNPPLASMLLSKLRTGAMGAAGLKVPDASTSEAWTAATIAQAVGATKWTVLRDAPNSISASIVRETAPRNQHPHKPLYRLMVSCNTATREGELQLTWSPEPQVDRNFIVQLDSAPGVAHRLMGREQKMGNGVNATTGLASFVLPPALPKQTLTVRDLFPGETVVFPLNELDSTHRREFEPCFAVR